MGGGGGYNLKNEDHRALQEIKMFRLGLLSLSRGFNEMDLENNIDKFRKK